MVSAREPAIRRAVLDAMERSATFSAFDIARAIDPARERELLGDVVRVMRRLFDQGLFDELGYRRTMIKHTTQEGVMSAVAFTPKRSSTPSPPSARSRRKRAAIEARPFGYLGIPLREARRLDRQTRTLRTALSSSGRDLVRIGKLLLGVESLLGSSHAGEYFEKELALSRDTARRLMRVARAFHRRDEIEPIASVRPSILYKLTEPSFPKELKDAILRERALTVDGTRIALESLKPRDLLLAKRQWLERLQERQDLQRRLAELLHPASAADLEEQHRVRARLSAISRLSPTAVVTPEKTERQVEALTGLAKGAAKLASEIEGLERPLPDEVKRAGIDALKLLIRELEK
jgi:hypothetical protein